MLVRYFLLHLPIHRRSFAEYYQEHDREVVSLKPEIEREWGTSFDDLPPHIRLYWKDQWYWPPWYFADVAAYLRIGSDGGNSLVADLFLRRRYFPSTAPESFSRRGGGPEDQDEMVYLASIGRRPIDIQNNETYVTALAEIVEEARNTVRQQGSGLTRAEVWLPGYDLSCFDFARADRQLRERFPERVQQPLQP
jgi:hypothetical protein